MLSGMSATPPQSDEEIAQLLGLIPPQRVLGWAQDGPDESSLVAVVDISGSGYIETWVAAGGGLTMSGLGYGFTGTVAFATARRRDGNSVLKIEVRHGTDVVCEADVAPNSRGFAVWARDLDAHGEWPPHASDVAPISCTMRWLPLDAPRALRKDADVDARLDAARAIATVLRPAVGWVLIELGDSAPEVSALLARARSLPLTSTDGSGVVWEGPTSDPGVWAWALDCLPVASWWHLYEGLSADDELLTYATDSLVGMWVLAPFDHEDLRGWLVRG